MKKTKESLIVLAIGLMCPGRNGAPAIDVLGSVFPAWMVCLAAVALAFVVRYFLVKHQLESEVGHLAIFYPCIVALCVSGLWLLFFR